ncbi:hypothetical protein Moror_2410 [Moniliophthora roreri MCA 2997]|uniref:Uncharacterized protein n=1 Tax=Moniliophthora roreri (strain MCA 2997) TaxID=1381753 RepID=V2WW42_MONRO|nr:hypothetical protein Moror_2410 [Moniliophthora roreri MCA 2997]
MEELKVHSVILADRASRVVSFMVFTPVKHQHQEGLIRIGFRWSRHGSRFATYLRSDGVPRLIEIEARIQSRGMSFSLLIIIVCTERLTNLNLSCDNERDLLVLSHP